MRKRILLIDDEYLSLAMLEDILGARGYEVLTATRASSGFEQALWGRPQLIILDIILPDRDGFSLLADLKKNDRTRSIPVVMLSALSRSQSFEVEQAAAFVQKPIVRKEILATVEDIIGPALNPEEEGPTQVVQR